MANINNCVTCTNMPGGNNNGYGDPYGDLALVVNSNSQNIHQTYRLKFSGIVPQNNVTPPVGYNGYGERFYKPDGFNGYIPYSIPANGATVSFRLQPLCQYPIWGGPYPPNGAILGRLNVSGHPYSGNFETPGYNVIINFPPYNGTQNEILFEWRGVFYASESQFLEECQTNSIEDASTCEFYIQFRVRYEQCEPTCLVQTVDTPSTRLNAIVDEKNVYWPLENGVFTDCIPNSSGTKNAVKKIKEKMIEIDKHYYNCAYTTNPQLTVQSIPDIKGNCIRFTATGFKSKFRMLHWGGANDPSFFNHSGC